MIETGCSYKHNDTGRVGKIICLGQEAYGGEPMVTYSLEDEPGVTWVRSRRDFEAKFTKQGPAPVAPHAKERALYWAQRAAGTCEVWQWIDRSGNGDGCWHDIGNDEPSWYPGIDYRVKPKMTKHYFALFKSARGDIKASTDVTEEGLMEWAKKVGHTIIGEIEFREV